MTTDTTLREALEAARYWFETQKKIISKGGPSSWDMLQCDEQMATIDVALTQHEALRATKPAVDVVDVCLDPVVEANRALLHQRSQVGIRKYGVTLENAGLSRRELMTHALEEVLDLANYIQADLRRDERECASASAPASTAMVKVERNRVWITRDAQSFMLAYEADSDEELQWYAGRLRCVLSGFTPNVNVEPNGAAAGARDTARLDWLERMANNPEGLLLHDGGDFSSRIGLGLRRIGRTLRQACDQAMKYDLVEMQKEGDTPP